MKNDRVFFLDELTKVFARHPNWTMPKDQLNGTAPASPQRDGLSDMRVTVFMRLPPDSSMVNYFWKVLSETDAMGICRRIVGMVAPHDTVKFEAPLYDVQAQWESLRAFPVNTGQLLDRTMELRGGKACDIFNKFVEKINMRSSDFSDPKVPAQRKPGARKPRFLRLAARQADGPRGMRAACGTSSGSGTCVVDTTKTRKGLKRAERAGEIRRIPGNVMGPYQVTGRENSDRSSVLPHSQRIPCLNPMPQETKVNRQMRRTPLIAR